MALRKAQRAAPGVYNGGLFAEQNDKIIRYPLPANGLVPGEQPHVIVSGLPRLLRLCRRHQPGLYQLATKRFDVGDRSSTAAVVLPKNKMSPGRRLTPRTTRS